MSTTPPLTVKSRIKNAIRIDRAFSLVWAASPKWTIINSLLIVVQAITPLVALYLIKLVIDTISFAIQADEGDAVVGKLVLLIVAAAGVALIQAGVGKLSAYATEAQSTIVTDYVYDVMHKKSIALDLAYYENPQYYDTLHRAQQEGPYRPTRIVSGLNQFVQNLALLIVMAGLLFSFHWVVGLLLFVSTLPGVVVQILFARRNFRWQKEVTPLERRADYYNWLLTGDMFAKELRLFNLGNFFSEGFNGLREKVRGEKLALTRQRSGAEFLAEAFGVVVLMGCFLLIGIRTIKGYITIGDMVMYFQAFQRGLTSLKSCLQNLSGLYEDNLFVSLFFTFLDTKSKVVEPENPVPIKQDELEPIEFSKVSFSYPGARAPVLNEVSLTINPGEVVALVGANGAGKSTIVKLLCRLYDPDKGNLLYGKTDFKNLITSELRSQVSVVFQDFVKYQMTVYDNIRLGRIDKESDRNDLHKAAKSAGVDTLLDQLPRKYETMLGKWFSEGEELSHGEWQKIVIARAFYRDANLIILDEPSASLDADSEYELFLNFKELLDGKCALIISHRFSTVKMADRILVLEDGRIIENGSHNELISLQGRYAKMYEKQASWICRSTA